MPSKLSRSLGILRKLSGYLPIEILKTLYSFLLLPYLTNAIEMWYGTYNTENFFRVKVTQKLSHDVPILTHIRRHFDSFLEKPSQFDPEKLSQIDSNSPMTQLLSQVDSKKLALFLVTQFSSQLTKKLSHCRI